MNDVLLDPIFNLQTVPPLKPDKWLDDTSTILTQVSIETARPIVLTQDPAKLLNPKRNYVYLPATASISIHADEVTVCGKLSFPGRNVVIVTRVLGAEDDGSNPAIISVDGAPLAEEKAHPAFLPKGVPPKGKPEKAGKVPVGRPDWSPSNHPNEMNGEDGDEGKPGNAAGNVWICCQKTSFHGTEHKLTIAAEGRRGGDGQRGQDGADGAPGKDGRSTKETDGRAEKGTNGGDAGNGGKGGKAGQGGHGGSIQFHCIASQPALAINCQGGDPGTPGEGGKRGQKGRRGEGGKGGTAVRSGGVGMGVSYVQFDDEPPGKEGQDGRDGDPGGEADSSNPGSSRITWGEVDYTDLVQMASITQLQMLFERTRADYLLTEPPNYSLRLMAVAPLKDSSSSAPDLVNEGTNLIVVGSSRDGLHVRIFDGSGQKVVDKQEPEMIKAQRPLQISMADVLEAGNWVTTEGLKRMSVKEQQALMSSAGQRQALIGQLSRISGLPEDAFKKLNDYDLTGWGAVAAFLLQMGSRNEAGLKFNLHAYRNALIPEVAHNTDYDEASLQKLSNEELLQVALDPQPRNKFVVRGGMVVLRERLFGMTLSDVLQAGNWRTPAQLDKMSAQDQRQALIDELIRISGLPEDAFKKLNDYDLTGWGGLAAFLLQMGIRDEIALKINAEAYRNALINAVVPEIARNTGYDEASLRKLNNQELVRVALDPDLFSPVPRNKFVLRGGMDFLRHQLFSQIPPITLSDVLQAGGWITAHELSWMQYPDHRKTLINQLRWKTGLVNEFHDKLYDRDLIDFGAAMAFLLQMGIRDEASFKGDRECGRSTLIGEVAGKCGYDRKYLEGLNNEELVRLALDPKPTNQFALRGGMVFLRRQLFRTISLGEVLQAGNWITPAELDNMRAGNMSAQAQRQRLVDQFSRISDLKKDIFGKLNDDDLIGLGAVMAFLLQMGIRDEAGLKANLKDYRNTLIVEVAGKCGYEGGYLQTLDNQQLVRLALEQKRTKKFALRNGMIFLRGRVFRSMSLRDVLQAGNWTTEAVLDKMSPQDQRQALIDQLSRICDLRKDMFDEVNDNNLIGYGAVMAFLLQVGIRDEVGLKANLEDYRNTLILAVAGNCGYEVDYLQGRRNLELVQLALEPKEQNKFVIRGGMLLLQKRLLGTEKVAALKKLFEMSLSDVLRAGGWVAPDPLKAMSVQDQRQALIDQLSRISGLPKAEFEKLNDYDLIGRGAVTVFLLQMGIGDEAGLKVQLDYRNTLIMEVAGKCGYDEHSVRGLDDYQLVRVALEPKPGNKLVPRGGMVLVRNRLFPSMSLADVLQAGGWVAPDRLSSMSIEGQRQAMINELSRISGRPPEEVFSVTRNDDGLAGCGAAAAFLLQMGIRDEAGLKGALAILRDTLIKEAAANTSYEQYLLRGLDNHQLVRVALEPKPGNKFVPRGGMVFLRNRLFPTTSLPDVSLADVLQAGNWRARAQLDKLSAQDQRQALKDELSRITSVAKAEFSTLNDHDLIGRGLAIAFLLQMSIRDEAGLKHHDPDQERNTLIAQVAGSCGYDVGYLQGLDNQQVVRLALEPKRTNHFVLRGNLLDLRDRFCNASKIPLRKQEGIIALAADIANYTDTWSSIGQRLEWLFHLLKAASKDYPDEPKKEHPEKALAKTIQPSVWSATNNHIDGLDYYGHTPDWVPIISLGEYLDAFKNSVNRLEGIETTHKDYFAAWNNQTAATEHLKTVLGSVDDYKDFLSDRIKAVKEDKDRTEKSINTKDTEREGLEDSLNTQLKNFEEKVKTAFGLTLETFLNCLSQLGFANFSEPARALKTLSKQGGLLKADLVEGGAVVGGFASAGAMVAGPVGMMLNEGVNNILNDYGERVNKKWLLQQIDVISGDLDLRSELQDRSDGFKSYTASQRVLVELSKFEELCKQFRKSVPEEAQLRKDLDAYIENITTRNRYIDYYNSLVQDLLDLLGDRKKIETRKSVVEGQLALTSNPGLPAMATFVSALFERAKAECLYDFYLAKRAYSFWALEPYGKFFDSIQNPEAITSKSLRVDHGTLTSQILKRLEDGFGSVSFFPRRDKSEASLGVIVVLSKESHPDFFQDLQDENKADFELEPATYASTKPSKAYAPTKVAWSGTRPELDPSTPHPFHGKTNVRLTKARPWIVGLYTESGSTTVKLTHLGEERFRSSENEPYPPCTDNQESEYVSHRPKDIDFAYSAAGLSWSPMADIFTPGQLTQDGDLGFPQPGAGLKDKHESIYAPIGPFGKWTLTVRPEDNTEDPKNKPLNWDSVEAIVIDFHVFAEGFSSEMVRGARAAAGRR